MQRARWPLAEEKKSDSHKTTAAKNDDDLDSPIDALCRKLRRQYGAAAGTTLLPPLVADRASSSTADPWERTTIATDPLLVDDSKTPADPVITAASILEATTLVDGAVCDCGRRRQSLGGGSLAHSPLRRSSSSRIGEVCPYCGGRRPRRSLLIDATSTDPRRPSLRRNTSVSVTGLATEDPAHARHFLQDTPQLRFLSTHQDMNAMDTTAPQAAAAAVVLFWGSDHRRGLLFHEDYATTVHRYQHHQRVAAELASLLGTLWHEMSLEDFETVESTVFSQVFALVHTKQERWPRMAGMAALMALLEAPSADEERKGIKFAYTLSQALRNGAGDFEFLHATTQALGRMAQKTANVDFGKFCNVYFLNFGRVFLIPDHSIFTDAFAVESEVTRALEWLRTERSDRR